MKEKYAMKPFLCYIGIHRYKDFIDIGKCNSEGGLQFTSEERCGCGKSRHSCSGVIELPESDRHRDRHRVAQSITTIVPCKECNEHPCTCTKGNQDD